MIRDRRMILGLLGAALLSVAVAPFLLQTDDPELALRRSQIATMSEAERQRLQRNFKQFESMSDAQRQQLRDFDAALETDRVTGHGRLSDTLSVYADWLKTVTPHQRDALQQESNPSKRIAMIREIVASQRDERVETRMGGRLEEFLGPIPSLGQQDLSAMLEIIVEKAPRLVSAEGLDELKSYPASRRPLKLFELLARANRDVRDLLSDTTIQQLLEAVTDEQTRQELETIPESERLDPFQARRLKMGLAIQKAIFVELDREHRRRELTQENLQKFFERLPPDEQDELLTRSPEEFQLELRGRYIEAEWSENPIKLTLIRQFFRPQQPEERPPFRGRRREERGGRPRFPNRRPPDRP